MAKTTKYFNLTEFMNGKKATNGLGNPVKFITLTRDKMLVKVYHRYKVIGFSHKEVVPEFEGRVEKFNLNGKKYAGTDTVWDIEMEAPKFNRPRDAKGRFVKA